MRLDLHTHTTYSDGDLDINGNVLEAIKHNLDGIAITDHDNIDSWEEIDNNNYPITVIKGVELSTYYKGESVHLLGYYLNDGGDYLELNKFLINTRKERIERLNKIIDLLSKYDIILTPKEIIREADGAVARPHIARAIMKKYSDRGYTKEYIFDNYIGNDAPCYVPVNNFQTEDAVKLLHDNHCLAVVAHPLYIKKFNYRELKDLGIDGIESIYPYEFDNSKDVLKFTEKNNLIVTGGSDFHGPRTRDTIGKTYVDGERSKIFLKTINYKK